MADQKAQNEPIITDVTKNEIKAKEELDPMWDKPHKKRYNYSYGIQTLVKLL